MDDSTQISDREAMAIYQHEWVPMEFAERFGRPAPARVREVVERAYAGGADEGALAVVVANQDISQSEASVVLRQERIVWALTIATRSISTFAAIYWIALGVHANTALWVKALLLIGGLVVVGGCAAVWEFYSGKALRALRAVRRELEQAIHDTSPRGTAAPAEVIDIASRRRQ